MPLKVLVIDNNAAEATLVNRTLGAEGYEVANATSLSEGLSLFADGSVDLLLISADTPAEDVVAWRSNAPQVVTDVPLILMGEANPDVQASATLATPIDTGHLIATVRAQVGSPVAATAHRAGAIQGAGAIAWLPDALRDSNDEMAQVERLLGWRPATDGAEDQNPVSLGIFSDAEADAAPVENALLEEASANAAPEGIGGLADLGGVAAESPENDATLTVDDGSLVANGSGLTTNADGQNPLDSLDLPETIAEDPIPEQDDPLAAVEGLQVADEPQPEADAPEDAPAIAAIDSTLVNAATEPETPELALADSDVEPEPDTAPALIAKSAEAIGDESIDATSGDTTEVAFASLNPDDEACETTEVCETTEACEATEATDTSDTTEPLRADSEPDAVADETSATLAGSADADDDTAIDTSIDTDTTEAAFASLNLDDEPEDAPAVDTADEAATILADAPEAPPLNTGSAADLSSSESATLQQPPATPSASAADGGFDDALESQVMDELDAAFAAFETPTDSTSLDLGDEAEADEVIAEDLMADDLIPEASHGKETQASQASQASQAEAIEVDEVDEAVESVMSEIIPELAAEATPTARGADDIADSIVAEMTADEDSPEVIAAKQVFGDPSQKAAKTDAPVVDEVQDLMDSLASLLDDDDELLPAPTPSDTKTVAETPEVEVMTAATDLSDAIPVEAVVDNAVSNDASPADSADILAAAGVEEDGTVPLSAAPPAAPKPGIGPPLVTKVVGDDALPADIAGLPMEKIERIIADVAREVVERVVWETVPALVVQALTEKREEQDKMFAKIVEKAVWETIPALAESRVTAEIQRLSED